jgi:low temperature requirement protein LtrA
MSDSTGTEPPVRLTRLREPGHEAALVEPIELFYDLVYVLAVTQLTGHLLAGLTPRGALETVVLLMAVWGAWIHVAWITNYFDPRTRATRLLLLALMFCSLIMSSSLPQSFGDQGLAFAGGLSASLLIGQTWVLVAVAGRHPLTAVFKRVLIWWLPTSALLVAGGLVNGDARLACWLAVLVVMYVVTATGFPVPGLGRALTSEYTIAGEHMAHRCYLFITIALGESILVIGSQFGQLPRQPSTLAAFMLAFLGSAGLWWLYFDRSAGAGIAAMATAADPGRLGVWAYTYFHLPMVAGVILAAAGYEIVIAQPAAEVDLPAAVLTLGGPLLFVAGLALFKGNIRGEFPLVSLIVIGALLALIPVALATSALVLLAATTGVVVVTAAVSSFAPRGSGRPSPR